MRAFSFSICLARFLAHQQFEQRAKVLRHLGLIVQCLRELILAQHLDEPIETDGDELILALGDGLLQQRRAARVVRRAQAPPCEAARFPGACTCRRFVVLRGPACRPRRSLRRALGPAAAQPPTNRQGRSPGRFPPASSEVVANVPCLILEQVADLLFMPLLRLFPELFLRLNYTPEEVERLVKILQFDHPIADFPHRQDDFVGLLLGKIAQIGAFCEVVEGRPKPVNPAFKLGEHRIGDRPERISDAILEAGNAARRCRFGCSPVASECRRSPRASPKTSWVPLLARRERSLDSNRSQRQLPGRASRPYRRSPVSCLAAGGGRDSLERESSQQIPRPGHLLNQLTRAAAAKQARGLRESHAVVRGATTSSVHRSLAETFGWRLRLHRSAALALTVIFWPGFSPNSLSSIARIGQHQLRGMLALWFGEIADRTFCPASAVRRVYSNHATAQSVVIGDAADQRQSGLRSDPPSRCRRVARRGCGGWSGSGVNTSRTGSRLRMPSVSVNVNSKVTSLHQRIERVREAMAILVQVHCVRAF